MELGNLSEGRTKVTKERKFDRQGSPEMTQAIEAQLNRLARLEDPTNKSLTARTYREMLAKAHAPHVRQTPS